MSANFDALEPVLMADEIQGNILGGFNKDHQAILPLHFGDDAAAVAAVRAWLTEILPSITWLREVVEYKRQRRLIMALTDAEPANLISLWCSIAFSYQGLRKLTAEADAFEHVFREGLPAASFRIGDPATEGAAGNVSTWLVGKPGEIPDMLFIIAGDDAAEVDQQVDQFLKHAKTFGITCPFFDVGHDLSHFSTDTTQFPRGHEHFGFKDGVSQPGVRGRMSTAPEDFLTPRTIPDTGDPNSAQPQFSAPGQPLICAGEFVLGYPRQLDSHARRADAPWKLGPEPFAPDADAIAPHWARNGSFLVYRRLRQNVPLFNQFLQSQVARLAQTTEFSGITLEALGARLVGRWPSGAPLLRSSTSDDANLGSTSGANNAFGFIQPTQDPADGFPTPVVDPFGRLCPQAAHIRKVNPRDLSTDQGAPTTTLVHRMLRRGIPYGPPLPFGATDDPDQLDRGLLFISYQASIREQFEFVAGSWMNDRAKPTPQLPPSDSGFDMIVGQNPNTAENRQRFCLIGKSKSIVSTSEFPDSQWVIATGGGYFFAPSRSAMSRVLAQSP